MSKISPVMMPKVGTVEELNRSVGVALSRLAQDVSIALRRVDAQQDRITNVSNAVEQTDAPNLNQVRDMIANGDADTLLSVRKLLPTLPNNTLYGTHATRPPAVTVPNGSLYYETNRTSWYQAQTVGGSKAWVWVGGRMQAAIANLPTDLGANDEGFEFAATTYHHVLRWNGSAWGWCPPDTGGGYIEMRVVAPTGDGWQVCDGSATDYLNEDGSVTAFTTPDWDGTAAYLKMGGTYTGTIVDAVAPTVNNPAATGTGTAAVSHTLSAGAGTAFLGTPSGTIGITSGTGAVVNVPSPSHTHIDFGHLHAISGGVSDAGHTHPQSAVTVDADADVRHSVVLPYFRR